MALAWTWDLLPSFLVASLLACTALVVLIVRPRRRAHQLFALFLLLVAGNFAFGAWATLGGINANQDPGHPYHVGAYLLLIWDPAVLLAFVATHPRPIRPRLRGPALAILLLPATLTVILLAQPALLVAAPPGLGKWILIAYMAFAYVACLLWLLWVLATAPTPLVRQEGTLLFVAFGVALVPRIGLVGTDLTIFAEYEAAGASAGLVLRLALAWGLLLLLALLGVAWTRPADRRRLVASFGAVASFLLVMSAIWTVSAQRLNTGDVFGSLTYAARWIAFAALVTIALVRHQLFGDLASLPTALRLGAGFAGVFLGLWLVPNLRAAADASTAWRPTTTEWAALALVVAGAGLAPLFLRAVLRQRATRRSAARRAHERRLDAYRGLLETLHADGRTDPARPELRALRETLGISMRDHERLATLVAWQWRSARVDGTGEPLRRFRIERPLGDGTWGQAYLASEASTGRAVVLKRLHGRDADDPAARDALLREARVLSKIRHPNVVTLLETITDPEPILVLEYVPGGSLEDRLANGSPVGGNEIVPVLRDALSGLGALHGAGLIHRDVKPSNVLLAAEGRAKVCDFGLARAARADRTRRDESADGPGNLAYASPEAAAGGPQDARSDLYAIAAILYRALTGRPPTDVEGLGDREARQRISHATAPAPNPTWPADWNRFFARALARDPARRFPSTDDLARELGAFLSASPPPRERGVPAARQA